MTARPMHRPKLAIALALSIAAAVSGCGKKEPAADPSVVAPPAASAPSASVPPPAAETVANPAAVPPPQPIQASDVVAQSWTPEAMEELLAPIALYPDPVLSQVLIAATNPQEVLDAGNWLIANEALKGKALDDAAAQVGFTPPVRALIQFPQTVDMMCMELGWTTELGEAFVADQAGVLDAVQRLRRQAKDVGNLQDSAAMKVTTEQQEGKEVIVLEPPKPEVVYVPTYDPVQAYAPLPQQTATTTAAVPATTTTTTTTTEQKSGYSGTQMFMTGALAFGAGILVSEIFDDDDDDYRNDYYYPNYGYGGMPYYPPYPYRPTYGNGYYPSNGYNRPPNYNNGFQNTGNIVINTGGNRPGAGGGGYWDRYDNNARPGVTNTGYRQPRANSPISQAKPNRPELNELNSRKPRPMPADYKRPSPNATAANWKGQSEYKGRDKKPATASRDPATRIAEAQPGYSRPPSKGGSSAANRPAPKVQGGYAGKDRPRPDTSPAKGPAKPASRDVPKPTPNTRDVKKPPAGGDRGYGTRDTPKPSPANASRPASKPAGASKPTVGSTANRGSADRAASQRGKQSLPQGARSKGAGGGGGGGGKKKQAR